ncbi:hypothetical protein [Sphingomonas dokdonensis]|uniref:Uncharacterized protein n=1 Tax=Sphingomonas dokdonensis TaxID=344880 RepID=A0A245ZTW3_9SPHN|nr:hypothetical protein [Sphingomonas dokdonensis]OWK33171.1 hypothetical protein SPDO_00450 [Sphingomonas dokdonensis]
MLPFATEFPVKQSNNKAAFAAEVFAWLRGMRHSQILAASSERELDGENVFLTAKGGEELRMRELRRGDDWDAIGFRHDMPDEQGRIWRTEAVLKRSLEQSGDDVVRLRTQCLAARPGAVLQSPKKPYLIKGLLKGSWGGIDGQIEVCDEPLWLEDSAEDLDLAEAIISGTGSQWLPIVYISAIGFEEWRLSENEIEKLAYDLGGVAHVVVEPSRTFSFKLRDVSDGKNIYGAR